MNHVCDQVDSVTFVAYSDGTMAISQPRVSPFLADEMRILAANRFLSDYKGLLTPAEVEFWQAVRKTTVLKSFEPPHLKRRHGN